MLKVPTLVIRTLLLGVFAGPFSVAAQFSAAQIIDLNLNGDFTVAAVADFDSDGMPDVVVGTRGQRQLKWLRNDGVGAFTLGRLLQSDMEVWHLEAADMDGDGDQDVVLVSAADPLLVQVFKNIDGTGFFEELPIQSALGAEVHRMELRDVDGDGDQDLVLIQPAMQRVVWIANTGDGSFSDTPQILFSGAEYSAMVWGDVTGDGGEDIFVAAGTAISWRACVDATCGGVQELEPAQTTVIDLFIADADGDGDLDLFAANADQVSQYTNTAGSVGARVAVVPDGASATQRHTVVLDVDGDDRAEIITVNGTTLRLWSNQGGQYTVDQNVPLEIGAPARIRPAQILPGGRPELLFIHLVRGQVSWLGEPDQPTPAYAPILHPIHSPISTGFPIVKPLLMDSDGDGIDDLFVAGSLELRRYAGSGSGQFEEGATIYRIPAGSRSLEKCDINGDTFPDILPVFQRVLSIQVNQGGSGWAPLDIWGPIADWPGGGPLGAQMADMDGNGTEDLVYLERPLGGIAPHRIRYRSNQGGFFGTLQTLYAQSSVQTIGFLILADIDSDGDEDILFRESGRIMYIENLGSGLFSAPPQTLVTLSAVNALIPADLDGDGALDLLIHQADGTNWLRNLGGWQMSAPQLIRPGAFTPMEVADIDLDGDDDILFIGADVIDIGRNDGVGVFTLEPLIPSGAQACRVHDVDGDGDLDLMCTGSGSAGVFWYENLEGTSSRVLGRVYTDTNTNGSFQVGEPGLEGV
ncbi:MAG: VCBS repeat-containing protein, partial [Flavobacteriales bacterium]